MTDETRPGFSSRCPRGDSHGREKGKRYVFSYLSDHEGKAVSLAMPVSKREYIFDGFPPFFDGLLPEGTQLDGLLRERKIDRNDSFSQLVAVGADMPGAVTVEAMDDLPDHV